MAKQSEPPPQLTAWSVYKIAKKAAWLGIVEAPDEATATEKAAAEFKVPVTRLMTIRRKGIIRRTVASLRRNIRLDQGALLSG
jgi:hypothetical protein